MKSKSNIGKIIISLPICIGLALFISANILNTTVKNHYIKIYGLYGNNIAIADIEELSLKDTIPTINKRVNGIMLTNGKKKGYFNIDGKNARLYLYNDESPFIYIKTFAVPKSIPISFASISFIPSFNILPHNLIYYLLYYN